MHAIKLDYRVMRQKHFLDLEIAGPGIKKQPIPVSMLWREKKSILKDTK